MRLSSLFGLLTGLAGFLLSTASWADFREFEDYEIDDEVVSMTTIKVNAGKGEEYLEGLVQTWVASNQIAKDLGHIEDFNIYTSRLPASGDFNVVLIITMKSMADFTYTKERSDAFMKKWGEQRRTKSKKTAKAYPELRTITGEYILGKVNLK